MERVGSSRRALLHGDAIARFRGLSTTEAVRDPAEDGLELNVRENRPRVVVARGDPEDVVGVAFGVCLSIDGGEGGCHVISFDCSDRATVSGSMTSTVLHCTRTVARTDSIQTLSGRNRPAGA